MNDTLDFSDAIKTGRTEDLFSGVSTDRDTSGRDDPGSAGGGGTGARPPDADAGIPRSAHARGLALKSIKVDKAWDRVWGFFEGTSDVFFLSVAFDLSGSDPVVLPPKETKASDQAVYQVRKGETITFNLGDGAPVFPPRVINGGLIAYISVVDVDEGLTKVGEVLQQVHKDLNEDESLLEAIKKFITNPAKTVVDEVLVAATAALQPIGTVLKSGGHDSIGLFQGIYSPTESWDNKLVDEKQKTTITLVELGTPG